MFLLFLKKVYSLKLQQGTKCAFRNFVLKSSNTLFFLIGLFYLFWGYNYHRSGLFLNQEWQEVDIDSSILVKELLSVTQKLNGYQKSDYDELYHIDSWAIIENEVRNSQTYLLQNWKYHTPGRVRIRPLYPKGILLRFSTAGFYNPFSFEGHVDPGLNPLQWPFTIAHEMAHGYGFTDEGECNFIGLVTCVSSDQKMLQYSGWISYWRYLFYDVHQRFPDIALHSYKSLHQNVQKDLQAIKRDSQKYPDVLPFVRDFIYDMYLKLHGIQDGLESYNDISTLMISYQIAQKQIFK